MREVADDVACDIERAQCVYRPLHHFANAVLVTYVGFDDDRSSTDRFDLARSCRGMIGVHIGDGNVAAGLRETQRPSSTDAHRPARYPRSRLGQPQQLLTDREHRYT